MQNHLICIYDFLLHFFFFCCGFQKKIEPSWRNRFEKQIEVGSAIPQIKEYTYYFLISNCIDTADILNWIERNVCFISDCRYSFNYKLNKKLINEEIIILYITSNALCSFEESVQVKCFWSIFKYIGTEFLLSMTHRVLIRLSKCANVPYHRNQMFL